MSILSGEKGFISFKMLFWLLVLFTVIHIGIRLVPMYMDAEQMKDEMAVKAGLAQTIKDEEILVDLAKKAKELGLPLGHDDFQLVRDDDGRKMTISTKWDVTLHFFYDLYPPYTVKVYHFAPVIKEDYSTKL